MGGFACWFGFVVGFLCWVCIYFLSCNSFNMGGFGGGGGGVTANRRYLGLFFSFRFPQLCGADPFFAFFDAVILFDDGYLYR